MLATEQIKKANENVMTIFDIAREEPAMEPAVHIPAKPIRIKMVNTLAMAPAFLIFFVCKDLPKKYDTKENVITDMEAIIRPAQSKKADWHGFNFGGDGKIIVEFTWDGSSQSMNS